MKKPSKHGGSVLVVVDMQSGFAAANQPSFLDAVEAEIRSANEAQWCIVALELLTENPLRYFGNTHEQLIRAARTVKVNADDPQRFFMRAKADMDGSQRVEDVCLKEGLAPQVFRVCGVKARACVEHTAVGLAMRFPHSLVEVVTRACNQDAPFDWSGFPCLPNLRLI